MCSFELFVEPSYVLDTRGCRSHLLPSDFDFHMPFFLDLRPKKKAAGRKPGGLSILEIISQKKATECLRWRFRDLVVSRLYDVPPDTPPGSDKNIGNNNY